VRLTLNGDVLTEIDMDILPTHEAQEIKVNLWSDGATAKTYMQNPGEWVSKIALVSGTITLPKGVVYEEGTGKVNAERTKTATGTNMGISTFNQIINEDGTATVNFTVGRMGGGLRQLTGELFSFKVKGGDPFDKGADGDTDELPGLNKKDGKIVINNIKMTISSGDAGTQVFPNEVLTVNVFNDNQVAFDSIWTDQIQEVRDSLETNKNLVNANSATFDSAFPKTAEQIQKATDAVEAFEKAVKDAYTKGDLSETTPEAVEKKQQALDSIGDILTTYYNEYSEGQEAIYNIYKDTTLRALTGEELNYRMYPGITKINDPENGTFITKKKELMQKFEDARGRVMMLELNLQPLADEIDQIINDFEDSVLVAKGLYETEGHEFALTQSHVLTPLTDEQKQLVKYPALAAIIGENGSFQAAKNAAKQKWEDAKTAGTAYDVDFADDFAAIDSIQEAYQKAIADADSAQQQHQATYDELVAKTLTPDPDNTWRNYYEVLDAKKDFKDAIDALEDKYNKVNPNSGDSTLVNYDFAAEKADIEAAIEAYAKACTKADSLAKANDSIANKALEDLAADKINWYGREDEIKDVDGIPELVEARNKAQEKLEENLSQVKGAGQLAGKTDGANFIPNPMLDKEEKLQKAFDELQTAIDEAVKRVDSLNNLIDDEIPGLDTELTVNQIALAHVVNPSTVQGSNKVKWLDQQAYDNLIAELGTLNDGIAGTIAQWKEQFLNGEMTKAELDDNLATVKAEEDAIMKEAMKKIVQHIVKHERGDVGGDGRWTTNDYARIRRMILDKKEPAITSWKKTGTGDYTEIEIDAENPEDAYAFARYDVNRDGKINVGDATAALNFTFYGDEFSHNPTYQEARSMNNVQENVSATANGNVIAISLNNGRQYSAFQMDVVLPEGMTVTAETLGLRNEGFTLSSNEVDGVHRILVTSSQNKAFEGTEGDVLYLEVAGKGSVEFKNVIFADVDAATKTFEIEAATVGETTGISTVKGESSVMGAIYNLGGRMMNGLKKGINIIRNASGETQKVIKK